MKIRIKPGNDRRVTIQEEGGVIKLIPESSHAVSATGRQGSEEIKSPTEISGKLLLATRYELKLLQELPDSGLSARNNFQTTDGYSDLQTRDKDRLWLAEDRSVTYVETSNAHYINGKGPVPVEEVLARYNSR